MNQTSTPTPKSKKWLWIGGIVVGLAVLGKIGEGNKPSSVAEDATTTPVETTAPAIPLAQQLKDEIAGAKKLTTVAAYSNYTDMAVQMAMFTAWARKIREAEASKDPVAKKQAVTLRQVAAKIQAKEFPRMRSAYVSLLKDKLWENDIVVSKVGSSTIEFAGGIFAANKNIKDFQNTVYEQIEPLRFRKIQYKWYKDADEFTYYDLKPPKDSELMD